MRYRRKPETIEAIKFIKLKEARLFLGKSYKWYATDGNKKIACIAFQTLKGEMAADIGDYLIRNITGEYRSCKPDIFEQMYEVV